MGGGSVGEDVHRRKLGQALAHAGTLPQPAGRCSVGTRNVVVIAGLAGFYSVSLLDSELGVNVGFRCAYT